MEVLAIIPARGGSKGIPGKNLVPVLGLSLLARAVRNARRCKGVGRVVVSTDDAAIAQAAREAGAEVPFLRPAELAGDRAETVAAVLHVVERLAETEGYTPDAVLLLQCTSPLVRHTDIEACLDLFAAKGAGSVVSVCRVEAHPILVGRIQEDQRFVYVLGAPPARTCRQGLAPYQRISGACYVTATCLLLQERQLYPEPHYACEMPERYALDIDTPEDLARLETLVQDPEFRDIYLLAPTAPAGGGHPAGAPAKE